MVDVCVLDFLVDVDGVWVEELRVGEGREEGLRELVGEEGILVRCLVPPDLCVDLFLLEEHPVEEGAAKVGDVDRIRGVNGGIVRELDSLDQVEDDGVFEPAGGGG